MDSTCAGLEFDSNGDTADFQLSEYSLPGILEANNQYSIIEEIGRGGTGIVFRARDLNLNREVAVKILHPEFVDRADIFSRFANESRIMGRLQHPNIANVYECGLTTSGQPFHIMRLVQGKTLGQIIKDVRSSDDGYGQLLNFFARVCEAMAYTHSQKILHLDLKPDNVMVGAFGEIHIMDWGLAHSLDFPDQVTRHHDSNTSGANRIHGTLHYMAPEQAKGETVDERTDVFCLGGILYEILTGQKPYHGDDRIEVWNLARAAELSEVHANLDRCGGNIALIRLARQCLQADPDDRPADASILANEVVRQSVSTLERAEQDMTRFFELSLDLFCIAGFDGFFRRINGNFSRVLGYTENELLTHPFLEFVIKEDQAKTIEVMGRLLDGEPVVRFRNRYLDTKGNLVEFEWTAKSIVDENVIFAVARNVTNGSSKLN
jgi:serine/threonine-protein kinase